MTAEQFAGEMKIFVEKWGVSLVGGCCGSTPGHIKALKEAVSGIEPAHREIQL